MKRILPLAIAFVVPILLFSFLGVVPGSASEEEEINKLIETATTPEDHIKIAEYYEKQVKKMEERARLHGTLADSYKNRGKPFSGLAKHCSDLSKRYTEAAKDYKAMAIDHMKMAQDVQKQ